MLKVGRGEGMLWIVIAVGIVILFLVLGFALKKVKESLSILVLVFIIASILILSFGILVIMDARDFQTKINEAPKKYILVEDERVLTGASMKGGELPAPFSRDEFDAIRKAFSENDLEKIRGNDYKLFIFDILSFESLLSQDLAIPGLNISLSREEVIATLTEENGRSIVVKKIYGGLAADVRSQIVYEEFESGIRERLGEEDAFKAKMMGLLLDRMVGENYLGFLKEGIREGHIRVYPQTIMFSMIKYAPKQVIATVVE